MNTRLELGKTQAELGWSIWAHAFYVRFSRLQKSFPAKKQLLEQFLIKPEQSNSSWDSELRIDYLCSIRIRSRNEDILQKLNFKPIVKLENRFLEVLQIHYSPYPYYRVVVYNRLDWAIYYYSQRDFVFSSFQAGDRSSQIFYLPSGWKFSLQNGSKNDKTVRSGN